MDLVIDTHGEIRCIYGEAIDLAALGTLSITRASYVEPDSEGWWFVDLRPSKGSTLGPFRSRSDAVRAEVPWLNQNGPDRFIRQHSP